MNDFDDIRPYSDSEFREHMNELLRDERFRSVMTALYQPQAVANSIMDQISHCEDTDSFQQNIVRPLLDRIVDTTSSGLTFSGFDQLDAQKNYLFISNHRDIILDPAFLNYIMFKVALPRTEIAIGDNLFVYDWIREMVKLNRAFVVRRNLAFREQLSASKHLSEYIRYAILEKKEPVWIAQKEGRAKDGCDKTQLAILKMLNMSNQKSLVEGFRDLNIVPLAISYEVEPCGVFKVEELLKRKHDPSFKKSQSDDLQSMGSGIMQFKGHMHFGFGKPLNDNIDEICKDLRPNDAIQAIAEYIDRCVYSNYKLRPNNYIACDLLEANNRHAEKYSEEEKSAFVERMNDDLSKVDFDYEESRPQYLEMYANPVLNFEKEQA